MCLSLGVFFAIVRTALGTMELEQGAGKLSQADVGVDSMVSAEVRQALTGALTFHLVDQQAAELISSYPELWEHLDSFSSAFFESTDFLLELQRIE